MKSLLLTAALTSTLLAGSASAALIGGVSAISSYSIATAGRTPEKTVNGSGLNGSATPDVPGSWQHQGGTTNFGQDLNWLAFARSSDPLPGVGNHWIAWDLGADQSLESMNFFNFGVSTGANNARGINQGDIYYRSDSFGSNTDNNNTAFDNSGWTLLGTAGLQTFTIGPTDANFQGADNIDLTGITARFFAIDVNSSHGDADFVGVGEVQFFTAIPEPSAGILSALAALGLLARRQR